MTVTLKKPQDVGLTMVDVESWQDEINKHFLMADSLVTELENDLWAQLEDLEAYIAQGTEAPAREGIEWTTKAVAQVRFLVKYGFLSDAPVVSLA